MTFHVTVVLAFRIEMQTKVAIESVRLGVLILMVLEGHLGSYYQQIILPKLRGIIYPNVGELRGSIRVITL